MATTTATITLNSTDLLSDELALSTTATLTSAGTSTGLTTDDKAHKVYLKNTETTASLYFLISIHDVEVGRLYAGDWALIPWSADTTGDNADFKITPSSSASHTLEYMLLHE